MILLIDNYDSFSYNLYQLVGSLSPDIQVVRNDQVSVEDIRRMNPSHLILSPGPGRPADAGVCEAAIRELSEELPILGVCLGHQAICEAFGGTVSYAKELMHGKPSQVALDLSCPLFRGCRTPSRRPGTTLWPRWRAPCRSASPSPPEPTTGRSWRCNIGTAPSMDCSSTPSPFSRRRGVRS